MENFGGGRILLIVPMYDHTIHIPVVYIPVSPLLCHFIAYIARWVNQAYCTDVVILRQVQGLGGELTTTKPK